MEGSVLGDAIDRCTRSCSFVSRKFEICLMEWGLFPCILSVTAVIYQGDCNDLVFPRLV